jgi:hypothetical protein
MMCGGSGPSVSAKTEEFYQAGKKNYGDLPSLALGDRVERTEDGMKDIPKKKKKKDVNKSATSTARSLLMPYAK